MYLLIAWLVFFTIIVSVLLGAFIQNRVEKKGGCTVNTKRSSTAIALLETILANGDKTDLRPLYELWYALFCQDRLSNRFQTGFIQYRKRFGEYALAIDQVEEIKKESVLSRAEYETVSHNDVVPSRIKKVARRRCQKLDSMLEKIVSGQGRKMIRREANSYFLSARF